MALPERHNWGEPERAPHDREVWCEGVQYNYVYLARTSRGQRCDIYICMRDSHVGAHVV